MNTSAISQQCEGENADLIEKTEVNHEHKTDTGNQVRGDAMKEAYPLYWPEGWPRTTTRSGSGFKQSFRSARNSLMAEIRRLGGSNVTLSSNVSLRNDGLPRATEPNPADPGVALYFTYQQQERVIACDKYRTATDNIYAIALNIEAIRGIERWGTSHMMERAFRGYMALPKRSSQWWRDELGFTHEERVTDKDVTEHFNQLVRKHHPDAGGDREKFEHLVTARNDAMKEITK